MIPEITHPHFWGFSEGGYPQFTPTSGAVLFPAFALSVWQEMRQGPVMNRASWGPSWAKSTCVRLGRWSGGCAVDDARGQSDEV
jgi:hypothetical protein